MKPKIIRVIRFDYFSSFLTIISVILTAILVLIVLFDTTLLPMIIPILLTSLVFLILRIFYVRKEVFRLKDSIITGLIHRFDHGNGMFYIVINYEYNTRSLGKRIPIVAGRIMRKKLRMLKEVKLLIDPEKPTKVYMKDFYYNLVK